MLKANETIRDTQFYNLHSGNHNELSDPHSQYIKKEYSSINGNLEVQLGGVKIVSGYYDVPASNGTGAVEITNPHTFSTWCSCVGSTVELVDGGSTYIGLYYSNVWASKEGIRITVDNPKSTSGSTIRVRYILMGE